MSWRNTGVSHMNTHTLMQRTGNGDDSQEQATGGTEGSITDTLRGKLWLFSSSDKVYSSFVFLADIFLALLDCLEALLEA